MVDLIFVSDDSSGESLLEILRIIDMARILPVIKDNVMGNLRRTVTINPYIGFLTVFDFHIVNTRSLDRSFVCMDYLTVVDRFIHTVLDEGQIVIRAFYDPVSQCIGGEINAVEFESFILAVKRKGIRIFSVNDGSYKRSSYDAVAEQASWTLC